MSLLLAAGFDGITDVIFGVIGGLLYPLFSVVFALIEMVEGVFKALAGIGDVSVNGKLITSNNSGGDFDSGLIYYMLNNQTVQDVFFSILMLALVLIIIFTVMAFIKNAYAAQPKNWQVIIGSSIKGLANFIFLPVCCLLGVLLGNILLQAINGATSKGGATAMDRKLFIACAYNANLVRTSDDAGGITWGQLDALTKNKMIIDNNKTFAEYYGISFSGKNANDKIINSQTSEEDKIYYANLIDQIFAETTVSLHTWGLNNTIYVTDTGTNQVSSFDTYLGVGSFYSLWQINYLVLIVGGIFMLYVLLALAFAMVKRMFYIVILFAISPAICSMYPLDDGNAVKTWSGEFKKQVLSAYGAVAGMNIFFSMIPLIDQIEIWSGGAGFFNDIFQIFMLVSGLLVVKDLIGLISGFVGGDNAYSTGSGLMSSTRSTMKKYGGGAVTKTTGAFAAAKGKAAAGNGSFLGNLAKATFKSVGKSATSAVTGGVLDIDGIKKTWKDNKKTGYDTAWDNYDARTKDAKKDDDSALRTLLKQYKNGKVDKLAAFEFLNGIKDDNAKKEYEKQIIAHDNAWTSKNGKGSLSKEGKYIEDAKAYKDFVEKTMPGQEKAILRTREKLDTAIKKKNEIEEEGKNTEWAFSELINHNQLKIAGFDNDKLTAMFKSGQKIDVSKLNEDDTDSKTYATVFNEYIDKKNNYSKDLEQATNRVSSLEESLGDAVLAAKDAVTDFAKSVKMDKEIDTGKLDGVVEDLAKQVKNTAESIDNIQKSFKGLSDINSLRK